jgi:NAD(P)-dependent dehydrogenase (short-subunit alcohol dehydrogenase family)
MTRVNKDSAESSTTGQQRVLITAGASGIGAAMVTAFLDDEAQVHVADLPGQLHDLPPGVTATAADVSDPDQVDQLFDEAVQVMGGVDVLCNNVGIAGPTGALEELEVSEWDRTMAVNVRSMFLCCRRAIPLMRAQEYRFHGGLSGLPLAESLRRFKMGGGGAKRHLGHGVGRVQYSGKYLVPGVGGW